jgi:hypothetical protein
MQLLERNFKCFCLRAMGRTHHRSSGAELYKPCRAGLECLGKNFMRRIVLVSAFLVFGLTAAAQQRAVYADPSAPAEQRITDLLSRMTLDEKVDSLSTDPTIPRLGIVGTGHVEGLHGLALGGPGGWQGGRGAECRSHHHLPAVARPRPDLGPRAAEAAAAQEALETRYAFGKYHKRRAGRPRAQRRPEPRPALGPQRGVLR